MIKPAEAQGAADGAETRVVTVKLFSRSSYWSRVTTPVSAPPSLKVLVMFQLVSA